MRKRTYIINNCLICNNEFKTYPYRVEKGGGRYCSAKCSPTVFKRHHLPWNTGIKRIHLSPKTEFKNYGYTFKGTKKEYLALHYWVRKIFGIPNECVYCGEPKFGRNVGWANVSHEYTKDLNDWIPLCIRCHFYYDRKEEVLAW